MAMVIKKGNKAKKGTRGTSVGSLTKSAAYDIVSPKQWLAEVVKRDFSADPEEHVFNHGSAVDIAESVKRFALRNRNKSANSFQSAMSMLNFYINRAGNNLPDSRMRILEDAKEHLKQFFIYHELKKS